MEILFRSKEDMTRVTDDQVYSELFAMGYDYSPLLGHLGELGELRAAVSLGNVLLHGRSREEALAMIDHVIGVNWKLAEEGNARSNKRMVRLLLKVLGVVVAITILMILLPLALEGASMLQ